MENLTPVCRICLNTSVDYIDFQTPVGSNEYPSESTDDEINYLQCLRLCTNLPIEEDDGGPQCLCVKCEVELQIVYKFLKKAQNSHAILENNWLKCDPDDEIIEHTEISIEQYDDAEHIDDLEHSVKDDLSDINEFSIDCEEFPNQFVFEEDKPFDLNDEIEITEVEEVIINECESNEPLHKVEYIQEDPDVSQNKTHRFIRKKYNCHICNRSYSTERHLKVHLNYHKRRNIGSKPYSCKICGEQFSFQRYLTQHMIEHKDYQEIHKCQFCDKEYVTKTALNSHKRIHQGEEVLNCTECGKQFYGSYEFNVHLRFHRREKEQRMHKCKICNKEYSSTRYLTQHMVVHLNNRDIHKCDYCNKEYVNKTALNNHKLRHEGQTLKCKDCGKEFTRNSELKIHMRFHKREHPLFKCTICEKKFTIKGHLRTHMWQHQGVKVECEECGKLFASTKALHEHSCTHAEMPYSCEFCHKAYSSKQKYKIHLEKVHCSELNEADLSDVDSLTNTNNVKMRKKFKYVQ